MHPFERCLTFLRALFALAGAGERGQAAVGLALSGCVCAAALGGAVLSAGDDAAQQLSQIFHSNLARVSGTLELRGSVLATASGKPAAVDNVQFVVGITGSAEPVPLDAMGADRLVLSYRDGSNVLADVPFTAKELAGDGDGALATGETALITVSAAAIAGATGAPAFATGSRWTLELQAPYGVPLTITRLTPSALDGVNDLH